MTTHCSARLPGGLISFALALAAAGCGGDKPAGTVAGTVAYNGSPVTAGSVNFLSKAGTGVAATAKIDESGAYKVDGPLEAGDYAVYVAPPPPEQLPPGTKPPPPRKFDVPPKFRDPGTSGVVVTVKSGKNDLPVELSK